MLTQKPTAHSPFLGDEVAADYETARVVILPIPYEATTTYRKGCQDGPASILDASQQVEYYDEELEQEYWPVGIYTHTPIADTRSQPMLTAAVMLQDTCKTVRSLWDDGKFVIGLGGEHSITEGLVRAYQESSSTPFTVVQIDAHADLRQEYEGSIHNHACVMRRVLDMGLPTVQIGIRSICREEADLIRDKNLCVFRAREIARQPDWIDRAIASIPTQSVFLTIDLDGIDPTQMPGVGTPEPGGLDWYGLTEFLRRLFEEYDVLGCDVMELAPVVDSVVSEFTAAKLVYKLIGYQAIAQQWEVPN
ncbi:agmatinase [Leptolyngbya sp. CCY15150]|uniref:agmatinase n=1 Tax=Leptolyngbya sp. CCY15150 TaxID=2767772 RepID=UPI0019503726|nr:agmatinase [Leptolyngbya sp. CCY15150]